MLEENRRVRGYRWTRGALAKARRHKSAKPWQIKSLSGSCEQIAPMHASRGSSLPRFLSSLVVLSSSYVSRHQPLFLRFSLSPPRFARFFSSFPFFFFETSSRSTVGMRSSPIRARCNNNWTPWRDSSRKSILGVTIFLSLIFHVPLN